MTERAAALTEHGQPTPARTERIRPGTASRTTGKNNTAARGHGMAGCQRPEGSPPRRLGVGVSVGVGVGGVGGVGCGRARGILPAVGTQPSPMPKLAVLSSPFFLVVVASRIRSVFAAKSDFLCLVTVERRRALSALTAACALRVVAYARSTLFSRAPMCS